MEAKGITYFIFVVFKLLMDLEIKWKELIPGKRTAYAYELKGVGLVATNNNGENITKVFLVQ